MTKNKAKSQPTVLGSKPLDAVVIGAGFSGICMGVKLKEAGLQFRIVEKAGNIGGTWRDNTYPGCACDTQSHHYSYSFAPNPDWSRLFPPQPEILEYLKGVARSHGLMPSIHFGEQVVGLEFDAAQSLWLVTTASRNIYRARFVISSVGQLNHPAIPEIPGIESFAGDAFHSARWNHRCSLAGKMVAVIGSGASAIQLIPPVAEQAEKLLVFQRSPNWLIPKNDRPYTEREKQRFRKFPLLEKLHRYGIYWSWERTWPEFRAGSRIARRRKAEASTDIASRVSDPKLADDLTPDYPLGCKRILLADNFYPAMQRDNVTLITESIEEIDETGLRTADGIHHEVDVIIYATGFRSHDFLKDIDVQGPAGRNLRNQWNGRPAAYLGMCIPNFPNLFMTYGPNTNLGHNSIIFMIECQARYIISAIERTMQQQATSITVTERAMSDFLARLDREMRGTAWLGNCSSWYKNEAGEVINNWSTTTYKYWWRTRKPKWSHFTLKT